MANFGLTSEVLNAIIQVFANNQKIEEVKIFGSRALGRHRPGSDIDLALYGSNLSLDDILSLQLLLDNLITPYKFDLVDINNLEIHEGLLEHITRVGVSIYDRNKRDQT